MTPTPPEADLSPEGPFRLGDRVTKIKGSAWHGRVVGFYATALTPAGVAVESEREPGSVQIYPVSALRALADPPPADGVGLETTAEKRSELARGSIPNGLGPHAQDVRALVNDFDKEHARAEGLAKELADERIRREVFEYGMREVQEQRNGLSKEVERLKAENVRLDLAAARNEKYLARAEAAEAKLAVYEAPVGDGEIQRVADNTHALSILAPLSNTERRWAAESEDMLRRLSAINAQREGENTKLREECAAVADADAEEFHKAAMAEADPAIKALHASGYSVASSIASRIRRAALSAGEAGT